MDDATRRPVRQVPSPKTLATVARLRKLLAERKGGLPDETTLSPLRRYLAARKSPTTGGKR